MIFPTKIITFIIQAVLVVIAVFIFSYIDPFNIFNSKKLTVKDKAVIVNSIKDIGELVTAEYYGEVIRSSQDTILFQLENEKRDWKKRLVEMELEVNQALGKIKDRNDSLRVKHPTRRDVLRDFYKQYPDITSDPDYQAYLEIVSDNLKEKEKTILFNIYSGKRLTLDIRKIKQTPPIQNKDSVFKWLVNQYVNDAFKEKEKSREVKQLVRHSATLLGRGWVKAGIVLNDLSDENVEYQKDKNLVILKNHRPEILSYTINPWFIPKLKIKGFEYLHISNKLDRQPDSKKTIALIQTLKSSCLYNLKQDALQAGLLEKARANAEENLGQLLSLILGKETHVKIFGHPLEALLFNLLSEKELNLKTIQVVDSVTKMYGTIDPTRTLEFLKTLNDSLKIAKFLKTQWKTEPAHWGIASQLLTANSDTFLTNAEKIKLHALYQLTSKSTITDSLYGSISNKLLAAHFLKPDSIWPDKKKNLTDAMSSLLLQNRKNLYLELNKADTVMFPGKILAAHE